MDIKNTFHLIEEDLRHEDWAIFFSLQVESYLEKYQRFLELHGD